MKTLLEFLSRRGFVVVTHGGKEHEAWAYEGPLDFEWRREGRKSALFTKTPLGAESAFP